MASPRAMTVCSSSDAIGDTAASPVFAEGSASQSSDSRIETDRACAVGADVRASVVCPTPPAMPDIVLLLVASLVPLFAVALALFAGRGERDRER